MLAANRTVCHSQAAGIVQHCFRSGLGVSRMELSSQCQLKESRFHAIKPAVHCINLSLIGTCLYTLYIATNVSPHLTVRFSHRKSHKQVQLISRINSNETRMGNHSNPVVLGVVQEGFGTTV